MAEAFKTILTDAGRGLLAKVLAGRGVIFTRGSLGSGVLADGEDAAALAGMLEPVADAALYCGGEDGGGTAMLTVQYTNDGLQKGFLASEVGVFAQEADEEGQAAGDELLYCYMNMGENPEPVTVAPPVMTRVYDMPVAVGRLDSMQVQIAPGVFATHSQLHTHTEDGENPHGVTATQVGLGNVDNTADSEKLVAGADSVRLAAEQESWGGRAWVRVVDVSGKTTADSTLMLRAAATGALAAGEMVIPVLAGGGGSNSYTAVGYKTDSGIWYAKLFNAAGAVLGSGIMVTVRYLHIRPVA